NRRQLLGEGAHAELGPGERLCRCREGIETAVEGVQLESRLAGTREKLLVGGAAKPPLQVGDVVELGLDVLEPPRLRLERREERREVARGLAQAQLDVA